MRANLCALSWSSSSDVTKMTKCEFSYCSPAMGSTVTEYSTVLSSIQGMSIRPLVKKYGPTS